MKLQIKQLYGDNIDIDISELSKISDLKAEISKCTKIPPNQISLLHVGKTLVDDKQLDFYTNLKEGSKINMVVKKPDGLSETLMKFLSKWYTREQCAKITDVFMKDFKTKAHNLSLDDVERLTLAWFGDVQGIH